MKADNPRKTRRIYLLTTAILVIPAAAGWMRFQQALRHWYYLIDLNVWPRPIYFAVSGGLIGIGYSLALIFHFLKLRFTEVYLRILGITLILWLWVDRIFVGIRESFRLLLPVTILITLFVISFDVFLFRKNSYLTKAGKNG